MVNNLKLTGPKTLTSADSDTTLSYSLPASTASGWCADYDETCINTQQLYASGDATLGTLYSWIVATAGQGTYSTTSGDVGSSICPKNWKLPTRNNTGSFQGLADAYGYSADVTGNPTNLFQRGYYIGSMGETERGYYWSSTAQSDIGAYYMRIGSGNNIVCEGISCGNGKQAGFSVRCVND